MNLDDKGFASAEFIFVTLIVLVLIGGLVTLVSNETHQAQTGDIGKARIAGEEIAEAINTAYINGNGYSVDINFPSDFSFTANITSISSEWYVVVFPGIQPGSNVTIKVIAKNFKSNYTINSNQRYRIINNNSQIVINTL